MGARRPLNAVAASGRSARPIKCALPRSAAPLSIARILSFASSRAEARSRPASTTTAEPVARGPFPAPRAHSPAVARAVPAATRARRRLPRAQRAKGKPARFRRPDGLTRGTPSQLPRSSCVPKARSMPIGRAERSRAAGERAPCRRSVRHESRCLRPRLRE